MINKIKIENVATYEDTVEINPTAINYFYGSNGSGKTTISKVINDYTKYPTCDITYSNPSDQIMVYNNDFVKENFSQSVSIRGIFTLGKDTKDCMDFIENANKEIENLKPQINGNKTTLRQKLERRIVEKNKIAEKCWKLKQRYNDIFSVAFKGYISSKEKFLNKCLYEKENKYDLLSEEEIIYKCKKVFSNSLTEYREIRNISYNKLKLLEDSKILSEKIIGKEDLQIGNLIKKLNNSDWVRHGIDYLDKSDSICPFCQKKIEDELKTTIYDFFDETYSRQCSELNSFKEEYKLYIESLINKLKEIIDLEIDILDTEKLINKIELINSKFKSNLLKIEEKMKLPSISIEIESLVNDFKEVTLIIDEYILAIKENNKLVKNISQEKNQLHGEIWRYIYAQLELDISEYNKIINGIEKAQQSINTSLQSKNQRLEELKRQINEKESEVTSVVHTVNEINRILRLFGFKNFKLAESDQKGFYKIIRPNGEDAQETLSEGEYTFITFLYFYQLIKGSTEKTGIISDRIVVIDDPISSLDSNVLFIVSNLVKQILKDCQEKRNGIKQVFVLTHNVYFHKEITFKGSRESNTKEETFWMIRKLNGKSTISEYKDNPIQTTYELLWSELYDIQKINTATIFNTLRRILEYYFNILGGIKYEECINKFEGEDKLICRSLISWINDGSHFIGDDLEMPMDSEKIEKYLEVFRLIFEKLGHGEHYKMMINRKQRI